MDTSTFLFLMLFLAAAMMVGIHLIVSHFGQPKSLGEELSMLSSIPKYMSPLWANVVAWWVEGGNKYRAAQHSYIQGRLQDELIKQSVFKTTFDSAVTPGRVVREELVAELADIAAIGTGLGTLDDIEADKKLKPGAEAAGVDLPELKEVNLTILRDQQELTKEQQDRQNKMQDAYTYKFMEEQIGIRLVQQYIDSLYIQIEEINDKFRNGQITEETRTQMVEDRKTDIQKAKLDKEQRHNRLVQISGGGEAGEADEDSEFSGNLRGKPKADQVRG